MTSSDATLHRWDDLPEERVTESLVRRLVTGERMTLAHLRLDAGARVPMHAHDNEQLSWVVEGALRFVVGAGEAGEEVFVGAGEVLHLPGGVPHSAEAVEDTLAVDVFSPPRHDWVDGDDAYLRGGEA